jgi:hypothetical protein
MDGSAATDERAGLVLPNLTIPHIDLLRFVPQRIADDDERELRWYLDSPLVASVSSGGGSFGAALERAESYGFGALPCRRCGGRWRRIVTRLNARTQELEQVVIGWRDGTGRQPKDRRGKGGKRETYADALARYRVEQRLKLKIVIGTYPSPSEESGVDAEKLWDATVASYWARGEALMTEADFREAFPTLPDELTTPCKRCGGIGVVPRRNPGEHAEITAWPTGSSAGTGGRENLDADGISNALERHSTGISDGAAVVSFRDLERWRAVDVLLADVGAMSPLARLALEAYYAPRHGGAAATRNRAQHRSTESFSGGWGREALASLVPARFETCSTPAALKSRTAREVEELYSHACQCWNACANGVAS